MKTKDEQFKIELIQLLKKFDAEIMLEDVDDPINPWSGEHTIVVNFDWDSQRETEPTKQINLGGYINQHD